MIVELDGTQAGPDRAGAPARPGPARLRRPKVVFLLVLLAVLGAYTEMAFAALDWSTQAGRIGPGFFPRLLGVAGLALTVWSLVAALRSDDAAADEVVPLEDEVGEGDLGRHPRLLALMIAAAAGFAATLLALGAIISSALFLVLMLWLLNRDRPWLNLAVSVLLPLGMYLLFQSLLNAGLPDGVLPGF